MAVQRKKIWNRSAPSTTKHTHLSASGKRPAKVAAKKAGRPYPNLVDNMRIKARKG